MIFVLDTNTCIYFLNGTYPSIREEISARTMEELGVASISAAELYYGAYHSHHRTRNLESLEFFLQEIQILPFDRMAAENFGQLKELLRSEGKTLGPYDLLIASVVRSRKHTLVTHNWKEFSQVKDLLLVDWVR